jgi:putative transposase
VASQGFQVVLEMEVASWPRLPENIRKLIVQMAQENPTWGQARLGAELSVKLGIYVSPRTVRAYWPSEPEPRGHRRTSSQNWRTFVRNQAQSIVACDFLVVVTARFRTLYVFLLMEVGTRRIVHCNVTAHPTAAWTLQQLREAIPSDHSYRSSGGIAMAGGMGGGQFGPLITDFLFQIFFRF